TVNGTLTLTSGNITTGANTMIIASGGSVSRTSGHVVGNLRKSVGTGSSIPLTFEVGTATDYTPVTVTFASVTTPGTLTATTTAGEHPDVANSGIDSTKDVNAFWTLTNAGTAFTNYSAVFNFTSGLIEAGANTANFIVAEKNAGTWSLPSVGT